jgi:hypothetical protein
MKLIGELSEQVHKTVIELQQKQDLLLKEIGKLEYQKDLMLTQIKMLQETTQKVLNQEVQALGIPTGAEWQVAKDRKVYVAEVGGL